MAACGLKFVEEKLSKKMRKQPPQYRMLKAATEFLKIVKKYKLKD